MWRREGIAIAEHPYPDDAYATGCGWPVAFSIETDASWPSGFYEISLHADGETGEERDDRRRSSSSVRIHRRLPNAILVLATNTYNAYNQWGGKCLYSGAVKMSFDRPLERGYLRRPSAPDEVPYDGRVNSLVDQPDEEHHPAAAVPRRLRLPDVVCVVGGWHTWERRFVRWAERKGLTLDYAVNSDLEFHPEVLDGQRLMLSVGHDEYWSWKMRDTRRRVRRRRRVVGDPLGQHLLLAGALRGRRPHDGRLQGPCRSDGSGCRHRRSPPARPRCGRCRRSAGPRRRRPASASPAAATHESGKATPRSAGGYMIHRPDHPVFEGTDLRYGDQLGQAGADRRLRGRWLRADDGQRRSRCRRTPMARRAGFEVLGTAPARLISINDERCEAPSRCGPASTRPVISKASPPVCSGRRHPRTSPASPTATR